MLAIEDLPQNEELDRTAMREVRGGMGVPGVPASIFSLVKNPQTSVGLHSLLQDQPLGLDQRSNFTF